MLEVSNVLKLSGHSAIVQLINQSNDTQLDENHLSSEFGINGAPLQTAIIRALAVTSEGVQGQYKGQQTVQYERPLMSTLLDPAVSLDVVIQYPFTFATLKEYFLTTYGLVLENIDIAQNKLSSLIMTDAFTFDETFPDIVDNRIELYIHPNSPRFCPDSIPGFKIRVVDNAAAELDLLIPTTYLNPMTTL